MEAMLQEVLQQIHSQCKQVTLSIHTDHEKCQTKSNIQGFVTNSQQQQQQHYSIYICQPNSYNQILLHELIHVYDQCINKWDLQKNKEQLLCSEIKAAYFAQCVSSSTESERKECTWKHASQSFKYSFPNQKEWLQTQQSLLKQYCSFS